MSQISVSAFAVLKQLEKASSVLVLMSLHVGNRKGLSKVTNDICTHLRTTCTHSATTTSSFVSSTQLVTEVNDVVVIFVVAYFTPLKESKIVTSRETGISVCHFEIAFKKLFILTCTVANIIRTLCFTRYVRNNSLHSVPNNMSIYKPLNYQADIEGLVLEYIKEQCMHYLGET